MINIYTDGSFKKINNIDYAGYGIYIENIKKISKKLPLTLKTNNRAELYAIIKAIKYSNKYYKNDIINIYTDSEYCIKVVTYYAKKIIENNKINTLNYDLLLIINNLLNKNFIFHKVKAHSTNENNNIADTLANIGCTKDFISNNKDYFYNYKLTFGKYNNIKLSDINKKDKKYLIWLHENIDSKKNKLLYLFLQYFCFF